MNLLIIPQSMHTTDYNYDIHGSSRVEWCVDIPTCDSTYVDKWQDNARTRSQNVLSVHRQQSWSTLLNSECVSCARTGWQYWMSTQNWNSGARLEFARSLWNRLYSLGSEIGKDKYTNSIRIQRVNRPQRQQIFVPKRSQGFRNSVMLIKKNGYSTGHYDFKNLCATISLGLAMKHDSICQGM